MIYCDFSESIYNSVKPKGPGLSSPVLQNTKQTEVAAPTYKRGFITPKIQAVRKFAHSLMVTGGMGLGYPNSKDRGRPLSVRTPARLFACFEHPIHLLRVKTQTVAPLIQTGIQPMSVISQRTTAPSPSKQDAIPTSNLHAVLAAFNASNMAASYVERGNFTAARRKLTQALSAINTLQAEG